MGVAVGDGSESEFGGFEGQAGFPSELELVFLRHVPSML